MIKSFDNETVTSTRKAIMEKLNELKELGLDIKLGSISYSDTMFTTKMTVSLSSAGTLEEQTYLNSYEGKMNPSLLHMKFRFENKEYIFRGFKPKARKNNAIIEDESGNKYVLPFSRIQKILIDTSK